jgi:hypothetical protein
VRPLKAYDIQFVGLKLGKHIYDYEINQTFFEYFEFDEFNTINVNLNIHLEKKTTLLELNFSGMDLLILTAMLVTSLMINQSILILI